MNTISWIILAVVVVAVAFATRSFFKNKGKCAGCSGECSSACSGCSGNCSACQVHNNESEKKQ